MHWLALDDRTTRASLAALERVHQGLAVAYDDTEYEPYTDEQRAFDAWCDQHPLAQESEAS